MPGTVVPYLLFTGEGGSIILQKAEDISTVIAERRGTTPKRPGYVATFLLLANRNRVEVTGETVSTVLDKLESVFGFRPAVYDASGQVDETAIQLEIEPEKEAANG